MRRLPLLILALLPQVALAWGEDGHELVNRAAARALPSDAPEWLRREARLTYLGPEPDRWRHAELTHMNKAFAPDHYVNLESVQGIDLDRPPENRFAWMEALRAADKKPDLVGFAPYHVVELCQRIEAAVVSLELIDPAHPEAAERRRQAEEVLVYVAGTLGHYVADLANPHHCTIHYNGWRGDNPERFATDDETHARFESVFVHREVEALRAAVKVVDETRRDLEYVRAIWDLVRESHGELKPLYRLDRDGAFAEGSDPARGVAFAARRMSRGATLLRDLWITASLRGARRAAALKLRMAIESALEREGIEVGVLVDLERRVTLRGRLEDPARHARAVELTRGVAGVQGVRSRVKVLY